ncbi:MAG: NAD(P)-dependent oxidoreductase [Alphaproteobacteria bacterium]|nr:NAD(P)-dependent oxidoreductase [Alphaproteobacteria bacterium]MCB9792379.1 NAD(P)-dependent oxidoreductase [Alphaproteobacteria bacterium]
MKILVTGAGGLLGSALVARGAHGLPRAALDVTDPVASEAALARLRPDAVIFCAAMTHVDRCATDPGAWAVNVEAPAWWAARAPTWFISSNYVFDGPGPHGPEAAPRPAMAYGAQKAEAERRVLAAGGHVLRTGWIFGRGGRNFPSRIFALLEAGPVRALRGWPVQPTWAGDLAEHLLGLPEGLSHAIGGEETDWAGFAASAARLAGCPERVQAVEALDLGPRPEDARLSPARLPGFTERLVTLHAGT